MEHSIQRIISESFAELHVEFRPTPQNGDEDRELIEFAKGLTAGEHETAVTFGRGSMWISLYKPLKKGDEQ